MKVVWLVLLGLQISGASAQNSLMPLRLAQVVTVYIPTMSLEPAPDGNYGIYIQLRPDGTSTHMEYTEMGPSYCTGHYVLTDYMFSETVERCGESLQTLSPANVHATTILISQKSAFSKFFSEHPILPIHRLTEKDASLMVQLSIRIDDKDVGTDQRPITFFDGGLP